MLLRVCWLQRLYASWRPWETLSSLCQLCGKSTVLNVTVQCAGAPELLCSKSLTPALVHSFALWSDLLGSPNLWDNWALRYLAFKQFWLVFKLLCYLALGSWVFQQEILWSLKNYYCRDGDLCTHIEAVNFECKNKIEKGSVSTAEKILFLMKT